MRPVAARRPPSVSGDFIRVVADYSVRGQRNGVLYGQHATSGLLATSSDHGVTWVDTSVNAFQAFGSPVYQFEWTNTHMWALATGNSRLFRCPIGQFGPWEEMTPAAMPATSIGRAGCLCVTTAGTVLVGNYNAEVPGRAYVFRYDGGTWSTVLDRSDARHIHAVQQRTANGDIFASVGDAGTAGTGLWRSQDDGLTWTQVASGRYGITMAFPPSTRGVPDRVVLDVDGPVPDIAYQWIYGATSIVPLVQENDVADGGAAWAGSGRGSTITTDGDLWWVTWGENGAIGTRGAIWLARGPFHKDAVLLEELFADPGDGLGYVSGPYLWFQRWRMTLPTLSA